MDPLVIILGALVAVFAGLNIYQLLAFRAMKKKYQAEAERDQAEAEESKQSALERRLKSLEEYCASQGNTIDALRKDILKLTEQKFDSDKRIVQLEGENKTMNEKIGVITKELNAYKTIVESTKHGKA